MSIFVALLLLVVKQIRLFTLFGLEMPVILSVFQFWYGIKQPLSITPGYNITKK